MEANNTALLVMDMQLAILGRLQDTSALIANVCRAIATARTRNIPVIYIVAGFRPGGPEVSLSNKAFMAMGGRERWTAEQATQFTNIHPDVAPQPGDITVTKRRFSAFTGSDLEVVLRAQGIQHLVLTGVSTSGVVLSTVREAADKDYRITVLADCCADADAEVHHVLTQKIFPRQADVVTVGEWN